MWKWTSSDNIKILILDADSLLKEYLEFDYTRYLETARVVKVSKRVTITSNGLCSYIDIPTLLNDILISNSNVESTSIISISDDIDFLKEMNQNHIGTVSTVNLSFPNFKMIPDFSCCDLKKISLILSGYCKGYAAEVFSYYGTDIKGKTLINTVDSYDNNLDFNIFFGGRYYPKKDNFLPNDPLSKHILDFKNRYVKEIDLFYDASISYLDNLFNFNLITYVPFKPKDKKVNRFNRFKSLTLNNCKAKGIVLSDILECTKDFDQKQNNAFTRSESVRGVFKVVEGANILNKNILVIDDVYTTGSTIKEVANTLYSAGAKKVVALLIACNQPITSSIKYKNIKCDKCGNDMILKSNSNNGSLFFGCNNYPKCGNTYQLDIGINKLIQANTIEIVNDNDLQDNY